MMYDFNADNAKLDAALAGKMGGFELIREITAQKAEQTLHLDLSEVNWDEWSLVIVSLYPVKGGNVPNELNLYVSGITNRNDYGTIDRSLNNRIMAFFPFRDGSRLMRYIAFPNGSISFSDSPYRNITDVYAHANASGGGGLGEGTTIKAYGLR